MAVSSLVGPAIFSLLEQDCYLEKVLEMLVEDGGVHNCRQVCHRWKRICDTLPLKIKSISVERLPLLTRLFPHANSIALSFPCTEMIGPALPNLAHLRCLRLHLFRNWQLPVVQKSHCMMERLHTLSLRVGSREILHSFIPMLRRMTKLESLEIELSKTVEAMEIDPISELHRIKELKLSSSLLINDVGELLFPKLRHLTRLETLTHGCNSDRMTAPLLEVIYPFAWNLRALRVGYSNILPFTNVASLAKFSRLESLRLDDIHCEDSDLTSVLWKMNALTELDVCNARGNAESLLEAVFSLTSLRSLGFSSLQSPAPRIELPSSFAEWTCLRRLCLRGIQVGSMFYCPAGLIELKIETLRDLPADLADCLVSMTGLVKLTVRNGGRRFCLPSRALCQMKGLQALALEQVEVDRQFFTTLAQLSRLAELQMIHYGHELDRPEFRNQLNLLSNLIALDFQCGTHGLSPLEYLFEGRLERLKDLTCSCSERDDVDEQEMFRRFPCLHKLCLKSNVDDFEEI